MLFYDKRTKNKVVKIVIKQMYKILKETKSFNDSFIFIIYIISMKISKFCNTVVFHI